MRTDSRVTFAAFVAGALLGCNAILPSVVGSGNSATEQRNVADFTELRVGHAIAVTVAVGAPTSMSVTADDNVLPRVRTTMSGNRLDVGLEGSVQVRTPVHVTITVPSLSWLAAHSAGRLTASGLDAESLSVSTDSAGVVEVVGRAGSVSVTANSGGMASLGQVDVANADVNIDSAGRATIRPTGTVNGSVDSGGVLVIQGNPASVNVETDTTGQVIRE
jgi:hypothetical protein